MTVVKEVPWCHVSSLAQFSGRAPAGLTWKYVHGIKFHGDGAVMVQEITEGVEHGMRKVQGVNQSLGVIKLQSDLQSVI